MFQTQPSTSSNRDYTEPTPKQRRLLEEMGELIPSTMTRSQAHRLIAQLVARQRQLPPTPRQEAILRQHGLWRPSLSRGQAFDLIAEIAEREEWSPRCDDDVD